MNKFVLGVLVLGALSPALLFASDATEGGSKQEVETHSSDDHPVLMRTGSGMIGSGMVRPPRMDDDRRMSGGKMGSGSTGSVIMPRPPKPPVGSGAALERDTKGLLLAMGKLTPTDRDTLMKTIREYLTSKGIDLAAYAEKRDDIKEVRKDTRVEIKEVKKETLAEIKVARKQAQEAIKAKREALRAKVKEVRSTGKVNVQDISLTK